MRKTIILLVAVILLLSLFSCKEERQTEPQIEESTYKVISVNTYENALIDESGYKVSCYNGMYIDEYFIGGKSIYLKMLDMRLYANDEDKQIELNDKSTLGYYIYDIDSKSSQGPLSEKEFKDSVKNQTIKWKKT